MMETEHKERETLEDFRKSFFYGARTDLNFKFLGKISDTEAGDFFQTLLHKIYTAYDAGDIKKVYDYVFQSQKDAYSKEVMFPYEDGPFTPMARPVSQSTILLFTSSGHFEKGHDPRPLGMDNMTQKEAVQNIMSFVKEAPVLSAISKTASAADLCVRHGGYDVTGAGKDPNVVFPLDLFRELEQKGHIGSLSDTAFSFVGACSQKRLLKTTGPMWVERLKTMNIDAVFFVPV